ncbi:nuclear transport factor 2 family protein [Planotetraspora kaengkrachanensis]|uniref:SnoaL-like domain-containing protein n=1 Tax=Planotetraspora kaengkrachanensis TaxID=575193 RepID=A0A8J3LVF1_9ACTN|nr:nuclear transport factor 2 family protein [Planotetraspora kaengkrachanensis]GIG79072.1 hypothetical protein Pka01_21990 [Planotetraspora kaengkrachanensis]
MDDVAELTQLVLHERQARDRGWWTRMNACFHPDSTVRLSWFAGGGPDFVAASREMSARGVRFTHRLCPPVVHHYGDRAVVEMPAAIETRTDVDGVQADLSSFARLLYRAGRHSGSWAVVSLDAVYERDILLPALPGTRLDLDPAVFMAYRPSYRVLAYLFDRLGYRVADDLYGDDVPGPVEELYRSVFAWAEG